MIKASHFALILADSYEKITKSNKWMHQYVQLKTKRDLKKNNEKKESNGRTESDRA